MLNQLVNKPLTGSSANPVASMSEGTIILKTPRLTTKGSTDPSPWRVEEFGLGALTKKPIAAAYADDLSHASFITPHLSNSSTGVLSLRVSKRI